MQEFTIQRNEYLNQTVRAFFHADYIGYRREGNPDYINTLKNTFNSYPAHVLNGAVQELRTVLQTDLSQILATLRIQSLTVCIVPRAKAEASYHSNQLLFKTSVRAVVNQLTGFVDGTDFIKRNTNTRTTHLPANTPNYNNDGATPYAGITKDTCSFSNNIRGKNILLIDDLYTRTVNIDEDAIQALLDNGALSVTFYSVGKTVFNR